MSSTPDRDPRPRKIRIMADYGGAYAWDEDGICTDIAEFFADRKEYRPLQTIEEKLMEWSKWFATSDIPDDLNFPWDEFHERGLVLAKKLFLLLKNNPPVFYQPPYEDPARRGAGDILIDYPPTYRKQRRV